MIAAARIDTIVTKAARQTLGTRRVTRTYSEPTVDSEGEDALKVTIVLAPKAVDRIDGDAVLDTLVKIQQELMAEGEQRRPMVEYATEDDLANGGD